MTAAVQCSEWISEWGYISCFNSFARIIDNLSSSISTQRLQISNRRGYYNLTPSQTRMRTQQNRYS